MADALASSSAPLAPNRIHSLPVLVRYHLPSSPQSFSALFPAPQQVYVHPSAAGRDGDQEALGSIYLKTVVQGVLLASPELHPAHPSTIDLSLYILDPRETFLRQSRQSLHPPSASSQVWTGKGLVSWALDEPGAGKNLITGRLLRTSTFAAVAGAASHDDADPMQALCRANSAEAAWGIEISLGLRSGGPPSTAPAVVSTVAAMESRRPSASSSADASRRLDSSPAPLLSMPASTPVPAPRHSAPHNRAPPPTSTPAAVERVLSPSRLVSTTPQTKARDAPGLKKLSTGKKRHPHNHNHNHPHPHRPRAGTHARKPRSATNSSSSDTETFALPANLFSDPASLTREQAERLLQSPAFLSKLSVLTGHPIIPLKRGRDDGDDDTKGPSAKEAKMAATRDTKEVKETRACRPSSSKGTDKEELKCWNCGRTKSAVWRMKMMDDGKSVRVCNACGLYWNKMRVMRPPTLWEGVDEEVKTYRKNDESEKPASRIDAAAASSPSGFKRTLSSVVNQDAKRIAAMRHTKVGPSSGLHQSVKPAPRTSPRRARASATKAVRNNRYTNTAAASSPGGWVEPMHPPPPPSDNFDPVKQKAGAQPEEGQGQAKNAPQESPNTAIRRILGTDTAMQSLELPLSDDGEGAPADKSASFDWSTDLSAFFDVDGFALNATGAPGTDGAVPVASDGTEADDDVLSQLFHRTSSAVMESSPAPFDFSQLPPSSPPIMSSDLPHSALLLSSPDLSPMDKKYSPAHSKAFTPACTFTPTDSKDTPQSTSAAPSTAQGHHDLKGLLGHSFDQSALETLWRMNEAHPSSATAAQDSVAPSDDIFAMFGESVSS